MQQKWPYRAYLINALVLILLVVILKDHMDGHKVLYRLVLAEIAVFCWAFQTALTLTTISSSLRSIHGVSGNSVVERVLMDSAVERRIWTILTVCTLTFGVLFNATYALRDVSILIPVLYFLMVSILVSLTSTWTSRLLLQGVINAAIEKSLPDLELRTNGESL